MEPSWEADRLPFSGPLDSNRFHCGPCQEEALARLHFLVEHGCRLGLLLGGSGLGKTWLLRTFRHALAGTGAEVALATLGGVDAYEFLWNVAVQLGTGPTPGQPLGRLWRHVSDHLAENRTLGRATVLLLDDASSATTHVLDQVQRIAELDAAGTAHLTMVLACNPAQLQHLGPQLVALSTLRIDLSPWSQRETTAHLQFVLASRGDQFPPLSPDAAVLLHQLSGGVPRHVNRLADLATLTAIGNGLDQTDVATLAAVGSRLGADGNDAPA